MGNRQGQKYLCECGAKVEYESACTCDTVGPFRCTCGATATEVED
jgi:hypothetical protein